MKADGAAILLGLDEFMLRLGHISVAVVAAEEVGAYRHRIVRRFEEIVTKPTKVSSHDQQLADYLAAKGLCAISGATKKYEQDRGKPKPPRYPDLILCGSEKAFTIGSISGRTPEVWWQDFCIASPNVRSRVGAITTKGRAGSKTGTSHVMDWAEFLEFLDSSGRATMLGRVLSSALGLSDTSRLEGQNPYILGDEKIFFAYQFLVTDFDFLVALLPALAASSEPITKSSGSKLLVTVVQALYGGLDRNASTARVNAIRSLYRDAMKKGRGSELEPNYATAWHRISSRLEMLVDIGLLCKGLDGPSELYAYKYYCTPAIRSLAKSIGEARSALSFAEEHFSEWCFQRSSDGTSLSQQQLLDVLPSAVHTMKASVGSLPLDILILAVCHKLQEHGQATNLLSIKEAIRQLAIDRPNVARLERGTGGASGDYVFIERRALG